jgi:hypothetical protein
VEKQNEELHDLYSPNIIRMIVQKDQMGGVCSMEGEKRNAYRLLVGTSEGRSPLGGPKVGGWMRWILLRIGSW